MFTTILDVARNRIYFIREDNMNRFSRLLSVGILVGITWLMLMSTVTRTAASTVNPSVVSAVTPVVTSTRQLPIADGQPLLASSALELLPSKAVASSGPVYYRTYGSYEFRSAHSDLTYAPSGGGLYALAIPPGGQSFKAPVDLPNGAQVNRIRFYVIDNSASDMTLALYQVEPAVSTGQSEIAWVSTSGLASSTAVRTVTITGTPIVTIDNLRYAYALRYAPVIAGMAHMLVGAQIEFSLPTNYLPVITR